MGWMQGIMQKDMNHVLKYAVVAPERITNGKVLFAGQTMAIDEMANLLHQKSNKFIKYKAELYQPDISNDVFEVRPLGDAKQHTGYSFCCSPFFLRRKFLPIAHLSYLPGYAIENPS